MNLGVFYTDEERAQADQLGLRDRGERSLDGWRMLGIAQHDADREPWAQVVVEVMPMPARFWRFTIQPIIEDVQPVVLTTGSGSLGDFWPVVEMFCNGMLHAEPS